MAGAPRANTAHTLPEARDDAGCHTVQYPSKSASRGIQKSALGMLVQELPGGQHHYVIKAGVTLLPDTHSRCDFATQSCL